MLIKFDFSLITLIIGSVAGRCCPEGMEPQSLLKFLEYLYNRVKDEIADEESFLRVTKRVLPTILQICQDRGGNQLLLNMVL